MYTTHEKIRREAGMQSPFRLLPFLNDPNGSQTNFFVATDDAVKIVPDFNTGATLAGVSDIQVWFGLSGLIGLSRMNVSSINEETGQVTLGTAPSTGGSLIVSFSSSPLGYQEVEDARAQAEASLNQKLALCYNLPITSNAPYLTQLATSAAAVRLLIKNYGTGALDTNGDGYALYNLVFGQNMALINQGTDAESANVGEIGLICGSNFVLVDDSGNIIPRNDDASIEGGGRFEVGGLVRGRLFDISEENFRYKDYQEDVNRPQPGSGIYPSQGNGWG